MAHGRNGLAPAWPRPMVRSPDAQHSLLGKPSSEAPRTGDIVETVLALGWAKPGFEIHPHHCESGHSIQPLYARFLTYKMGMIPSVSRSGNKGLARQRVQSAEHSAWNRMRISKWYLLLLLRWNYQDIDTKVAA